MEREKETNYYFNQGRLNCDHKWIDAINDRIKELEIQVGIPELRRLIKNHKFTWNLDEEEEELKKDKKPSKKERKR